MFFKDIESQSTGKINSSVSTAVWAELVLVTLMFEHKGDIPLRRFVVRVIDAYFIHQRISLEFQHGRHLVFRNFNTAAVTS